MFKRLLLPWWPRVVYSILPYSSYTWYDGINSCNSCSVYGFPSSSFADISNDAANATSDESSGAELGVEYSAGFGRVYALQQNTEVKTAAGVKTTDQQNTTVGLNYKVNSATQLVFFNQNVDESGTTNINDEFSSNTVGVRHDMAGGLRIGLLHSNYEYTDASAAATNDDGSATRLEVRVNF